MTYSFSKLHNAIFLIEFDNSYDLAMHFLRPQEFYESPEFAGKIFTILDFIEKYSKDNENKFTYADDWCGFNVPSYIIKRLYASHIPDLNKYDEFMKGIYKFIYENETQDFYLIGAKRGDTETIDHELAHALYYIDADYKSKQSANLNKLMDNGSGDYEKIKDTLVSYMKYGEKTIVDEMQAYLSTGPSDEHMEVYSKRSWKKISSPFESVFKKFKEKM